mgnify:CR=1 FL=1
MRNAPFFFLTQEVSQFYQINLFVPVHPVPQEYTNDREVTRAHDLEI